MSTTVKYKGSTIAELTESGTKTLKTSGKYCEADIVVENTKDGGGTITDGIVVKARDAEGYATEVDVYGSLFNAEFAYSDTRYDHGSGWNRLKIINLKTPTKIPRACFSWLTNLETINGVENITEIVGSDATGTMQSAGLVDCSFPNATYNGNSGVVFQNCPNLENIYLPKVNGLLSGGWFIIKQCPALKTVELGSVGNGVELGTYAFEGCTQTGLTITIYCTGDKTDANLTAIRTYATNATIIIKASADTTYNGTSYTAGATIVTSEATQ